MVTSQGATIEVLFDPDTDLTQRLNSEKEFQFVLKPTKEGEQDAEDGPSGVPLPSGETDNDGPGLVQIGD